MPPSFIATAGSGDRVHALWATDYFAAMLKADGPVMVDVRVAQLANCFPMIPSGAAHTDMILQANEVSGEMDDEAKALV